MGIEKVLLLNLPSFSDRRLCREIMGGFGLEVGGSLLYPPLPLAFAAAILERESVPVDILDAEALDLDAGAIEGRVREGGFTLVGLISSLITLRSDVAFADRLKAAVPGLRVFLTGPVIHLYKDWILRHSSVDFTVNTLNDDKPLELVRALEGDGPRGLSGISFRSGQEVVHNPDDERSIDLRELPVPARHLLPNERYFIAGMDGPMTTVQTGRGCPFRCEICAYKHSQGHVWRARELDSVMEELEQVVRGLGIRNVVFRDITFTIDRKRILELCRRIVESGLRFTWWAETTPNLVDVELLARMQEAGMDALSLGVETGSERVLDLYWKRKTLGLPETRAVFDACRRLGIHTRGYFVLGHPEETPEDDRETLRWARALRPTTLQFLPYRELPPEIDDYEVVDPALMKRIRRAYLAYYLTPRNLLGQLAQPKLLLNRVKRFASLGRG